MRLNTRGRYGIQLMAQLACHASQPHPMGLKQVAGHTGLPWRYLEQITRPLRRAALVKGRPGRTGGYVLAREPDRITLRDVIEATSGPICLMDCVDNPASCDHTATCTSRNVWMAVTQDIRDVLARYTLCDLAKRPCAGCRDAAASARAVRVVSQLKNGAASSKKRRARAPAGGGDAGPKKKTKRTGAHADAALRWSQLAGRISD